MPLADSAAATEAGEDLNTCACWTIMTAGQHMLEADSVSTQRKRLVVGCMVVFVTDLTLSLSVPMFGALPVTAAMAGLTLLAACLFSEIGLIALLCAISSISLVGGLEFDSVRNVKWVLTGIVASVTLLRLLVRPDPINIRFDPVVKFFVAYLCWGVFCSLTAVHPLANIYWVVSKTLFVGIYIVAIETISTRAHVNVILAILLATVLSSGIYSLVGLLGGPYTRIRGFMDNAGGYSVFLTVASSLLVVAFFIYRKPVMKLIYGIGALIGGVCLLLAWSRGTWLVISVAALAFLVLERKFRILITLVVCSATVIVLLATQTDAFSVFYKLVRLRAGTTHREALWESSVKAIRENPLTGRGFALSIDDMMSGRNADSDTRYFLLDKNGPFNAHNYYLQVVVSTGVPGLVILLLFFYRLFRDQLTSLREAPNRRQRTLHSAMLALAIGFSVGMFFDTGSMISSGSYANYFWITLGIVEAIKRKNLLAD